MPGCVLWLRRDLRLRDHPALLAAVEQADRGRVLPLFVLEPRLWRPAGPARRAWLLRSLAALRSATDGALTVRTGRGGPGQGDQPQRDAVRRVHPVRSRVAGARLAGAGAAPAAPDGTSGLSAHLKFGEIHRTGPRPRATTTGPSWRMRYAEPG